MDPCSAVVLGDLNGCSNPTEAVNVSLHLGNAILIALAGVSPLIYCRYVAHLIHLEYLGMVLGYTDVYQ